MRVSGPETVRVAESILGKCPEPKLATLAEFRAGDGTVLDQGIALFFNAPFSFTGEDVLELQGHGGPLVLDMILRCCLELGVRPAEPGEFTKRAFLNDKLDLAQAEAIADLISSKTEHAALNAMRSLQGRFSDILGDLVDDVIKFRASLEAAINFPEEDIDFRDDENINSDLRDIQSKLQNILYEAKTGVLLAEGATVVLLGKPNSGKSSLMNQFTGRETSIVTDLPGTTRDVVEEQLHLDGIPLRFIDTAGIRESVDAIEEEGIRRAIMASSLADLAIIIIDASLEYPEDDLRELSAITDIETVTVYNKMDLVSGNHLPDGVTPVSAKTSFGIEKLKDEIKRKLGYEEGFESSFTARTRHISSIKQGLSAVERGIFELEYNGAGELLAEELKQCQACLNEITGEFSADDLLGEIFGSFCIGK